MTATKPLPPAAGTGESTLPLSVRAVDKAAGMLAGAGSTRRRFLYRLAVVGSALALDPLKFITRPTPAYASVCGGGTGCDAGWSVFCCTINNGANTCPTGSFVAGWWKVDASAFCLGSARYYIDCNRTPSASCRCRCNTSGCDNRRVCCNVFRYGQCNTHIAGVTEVVCRIITCTPPWKWDPACSSTVREDEETRSHSAACLPGKDASRIALKYQDLGLVGSVLGAPVSRERDAARNGRKRRYENGMILTHRTTGPHEVHGPIARRFIDMGAEAGPLGYPTTDQIGVGDGRGNFNRFERGSIYRSGYTGARAVRGKSDVRYRRIGGPKHFLGYPTSSTRDAVGWGRVTTFERGAIYVSDDTEAWEVTGAIFDRLVEQGGPVTSGLHFPVGARRTMEDGGRVQLFERGLIAGAKGSRVYAVRGPIANRYRSAGGVTGAWGYPVSNTVPVEGAVRPGTMSRFETRRAYWSKPTGVRWLSGPILGRYLREGGPGGTLAYPTSDVQTDTTTGFERATFEGGVITHDPQTGQTEVLPPDPA